MDLLKLLTMLGMPQDSSMGMQAPMTNQFQQPLMPSMGKGADYAAQAFTGRTNYGVPQDNMIDTPNGYITPEQFNQLAPYDREAITQGLTPRLQVSQQPAAPRPGAAWSGLQMATSRDQTLQGNPDDGLRLQGGPVQRPSNALQGGMPARKLQATKNPQNALGRLLNF